MPGDMSHHSKYAVKLPYPEPKVESPNIEYANILLKDYAGAVSEFTAISLYIYQHFISDGDFDDYAKLIGGVSMAEMKHLELLAETIKLLGVKPIYINNVCPPGQLWTPLYVNYATNIKAMILEDIKAETMAIETYRYHLTIIRDKHIRKLIERILLDEEFHLKLFNEILEKYDNKI